VLSSPYGSEMEGNISDNFLLPSGNVHPFDRNK